MVAKNAPPSYSLNRIYIRQADIAMSMYKRSKEYGFTTEDVMRLHWDRSGNRALEWARVIIKRMRNDGIVVVLDDSTLSDKRRRLYRFTKEALETWGIYDAAAESAHEAKRKSK